MNWMGGKQVQGQDQPLVSDLGRILFFFFFFSLNHLKTTEEHCQTKALF